ncbi:anaerobic glycerol-3-phosphate dehydrogenase subunit GlpA [Desulfosporosinus youngiae]|nr:anaerobic glycerol-3-phosphate dehydrogenase subunit GlpA [Desulfosporosinus youngiae]
MVDYWAEVIIIGGGATGVGLLRDLSMRGVTALLLEQGDLAHGTSSRFHGLLHSGARYAAKDPLSAAECAVENSILKRIAPSCIVECGGWFVQMAEDDPEYTENWLQKCAEASIDLREIPLQDAYAQEPLLRRDAVRVFEVPDAAVDGFKLVWANAHSAAAYGGVYKTYHQVEKLVREGNRITGVCGRLVRTGEPFKAMSAVVVNAAGAWAPELAATVGVTLDVVADKGTLLAFNQRLFQRVINRLRAPGDGDIFVPHESITVFGTTSQSVNSPGDNVPAVADVEKLMKLGEGLLPEIERFRVIRAFAGVRPLYKETQSDPKAPDKGREVSRGFAIIDHQEQGVSGFLSIVGGKFTTYRLMAERTADQVTHKLGKFLPCRTAEETILPEISPALKELAQKVLPWGAVTKMLERAGSEAEGILHDIESDSAKGQMLCECEMVSLAEVEKTVADEDVHCLSDIRRKTRLGMGTCQGAFCGYRALPLLRREKNKYAPFREELRSFLDQRWKGIRPVLWGAQLRETELARGIYGGLLRFGEGSTCPRDRRK